MNFIEKPIVCPKSHCTCGTDVIIPKMRKGEMFEIIQKDKINEN